MKTDSDELDGRRRGRAGKESGCERGGKTDKRKGAMFLAGYLEAICQPQVGGGRPLSVLFTFRVGGLSHVHASAF